MKLLKGLIRTLGLLALLAGTAAAQAQPYPARPVRLVVPYAVGQGTDILARYVGDELGKALGQAVVIDNRPGAAGNLGSQLAARAPADGYTLLIGTNATHAANGFLYAQPGFDPQTDFEPIAMVGILPLVYVTRPSHPVGNMTELAAAARARPDGLNTAVSTTTCRMAHELFRQRADAPMFPVDFKGSAQAVTALLGGHVEFMVDTITSLRPQITSGQVKALGVTSATASQLLPGVRSLSEQGINGYELIGWTVLYAPRGLPPEVARTLTAAAMRTLERPEVQARLLAMGIDPQLKTGAALRQFLLTEKDKWGRLIQGAGLKPS